jgi:TPR repeat protein
VIHGIQPKQVVEDGQGLVEPAHTPQADAKAIEAAQEGPVLEMAPGQHALEARPQRKLADPLFHGEGGPKDLPGARTQYQLAADQGNARAREALDAMDKPDEAPPVAKH